ncbi:MAG TPA: phosphoribosylamine--glycine ligase [Dongiaceae bacterium]|jgi:phosphoribosylamine--glycine ligase|nr:phosphoribosylamine--glycine ligase [Dongiaceae bacterium]
MRILVVGGGAREHALCWKIAASPLVERIYCAPGNAGIAALADCIAIAETDIDALAAFAESTRIDLVVVGPEAPLVAGLTDLLAARGIPCCGPTAGAARLEGSKIFMKKVALSAGIPTAAYRVCRSVTDAESFSRQTSFPIVIKADGLAGGKGVIIAQDMRAFDQAIEDILIKRKFGHAGEEILIEEFLEGEEISYFALCDGEDYIPLGAVQDHKRAGEGETGPNTGGMGAYAPVSILDAALEKRVQEEIIAPALKTMKQAGHPFRGVLFAGLMITAQGPKLLEFNVRFGDPECEVMCLRLRSDIVPALMAVTDGTLRHISLTWYDDTAIAVVMAARGYPDSYTKGGVIRGLDKEPHVDAVIFHGGTQRAANGDIIAAGGRVLTVCARGRDIVAARLKAQAVLDRIDWADGYYRRDIGWRARA